MKEWQAKGIVIIVSIITALTAFCVTAKIKQIAYNNSIAESIEGVEKMTFKQAVWFTILTDNNNNNYNQTRR